METKRLSPDYLTCGQIDAHEMPVVEAMGVKTLLALRPDDEELGQPLFQTLAEQAQGMGIEAHQIPVPADGPTDADRARFEEIMKTAPRPVLAFCRTGRRAEILYEMVYGET